MKKIDNYEMMLRLFVPDLDERREEVERIAHIPFHQFIADEDMLAVAFYAGRSDDVVYDIQFAPGSVPQLATEKAKSFLSDDALVHEAARSGYFEKNIQKLLQLGAGNADYGAKLVQVFCCFLEHSQDHQLSPNVLKRMRKFIDDQGDKKGFIIKHQNEHQIHNCFFA